MIFALVYFAALVAFHFAQRADARVSEEGFARGYREGNKSIVRLFGSTPSYGRLVLYNYLQLLVFSLAVAWIPWPTIAYALPAIALVAAGKSMLAVRKWRKVFETNGAYLNESRTALEKFLGF